MKLIATATLALTIIGCATAPRTVTIQPGDSVPNMEPGDTLIVADTTRQECADMGGEYDFGACVGVDF